MTIGDRIKSLREERNITQQDLAKGIKSTKQTIYKYENNIITNIPSDKIETIATILGTTPTYLMGWEESTEYNNYTMISVYGSIPAGMPLEAIEDIQGQVDIPLSWLKGGREYLALKVKGDSMYPKYLEGDVVIIQKQPFCDSGQDCACYTNGYEATLKKVELNSDGVTLVPLNPNYPPKTFKPGEVTILGTVKEIRRRV